MKWEFSLPNMQVESLIKLLSSNLILHIYTITHVKEKVVVVTFNAQRECFGPFTKYPGIRYLHLKWLNAQRNQFIPMEPQQLVDSLTEAE